MARERVEDYLPYTPAAIQLQYLYIVKNPNPQGQRDQLLNAKDGSDYSSVHEKYHPAFDNIIKKFGYYDLYLIDYDTGRIVYDGAPPAPVRVSLPRPDLEAWKRDGNRGNSPHRPSWTQLFFHENYRDVEIFDEALVVGQAGAAVGRPSPLGSDGAVLGRGWEARCRNACRPELPRSRAA